MTSVPSFPVPSRLLALALLGVAAPAFAATYEQSLGVDVLDVFRVGVSASVNAPADPPATAKTAHEYLDGYNRVDSSGNLGEGAPGLPSRTSNFGFVSDSQVDLKSGTIAWHTVSPGESSYVNRSSLHATPGAELNYRVLRSNPGAASFGLEARVGYVDLDYSSSATLSTTSRLLTDTYQLGGVVPQPAPYNGSFTVQPGTQRIGDTPTRSITTVAATTSGSREFSAKGWLARLGIVWLPVRTQRVDVQLEGGPAMLDVKGELRLNDRWTTSGQPAYAATASASRSKALIGAYGGGSVRVNVSDHWSVWGGADFLSAGHLTVSAGAAKAKFTFAHAVLASAGVAFRW